VFFFTHYSNVICIPQPVIVFVKVYTFPLLPEYTNRQLPDSFNKLMVYGISFCISHQNYVNTHCNKSGNKHSNK
jgi:hypothetical protein